MKSAKLKAFALSLIPIYWITSQEEQKSKIDFPSEAIALLEYMRPTKETEYGYRKTQSETPSELQQKIEDTITNGVGYDAAFFFSKQKDDLNFHLAELELKTKNPDADVQMAFEELKTMYSTKKVGLISKFLSETGNVPRYTKMPVAQQFFGNIHPCTSCIESARKERVEEFDRYINAKNIRLQNTN